MFSAWKEKISKLFVIPQRYVLAIMGFLALTNCYAMRVALSLAMTEMVYHPNITYHHTSGGHGCEFPDTAEHTEILWSQGQVYHWSEKTQGVILGAFYWGYFVTHLPGGIVAERLGGKYTLGLGLLLSSIFNFFTPLIVIETKGSPAALIGIRIIEGLGEGTIYPALNAMLAHWVPMDERSRIGTTVFAGAMMGTIVGNLLGGAVMHQTKQWSSIFYLFGSSGILWFICFTCLCYSKPETHPFIKEEEKVYLKKQIGNLSEKALPIPWKAMVRSMPLWAVIIAGIGHDYGLFTLITELPLYMKDILKFNVAENGAWTSLPYFAMWIVSMLSGLLVDWLIKKKITSLTFSRKFFTTIAAVFPGMFMVAASYVGCDRHMVVAMFVIGTAFMGTYYCSMKLNALDLAPNYAGTVMAIVNGSGALTGVVAPFLAGLMTSQHTLEEWRVVFWICFVVFVVTSIIYILFASGETQWWNDPDLHETDVPEVDIGDVHYKDDRRGTITNQIIFYTI